MDSATGLVISEAFYSLQGEGVTSGFPAFFIRLTNCNLSCGGWGTMEDGELHGGASWRCDTMDKWKKGNLKGFSEITESLSHVFFLDRLADGAHLIFSGGEPLLQQDGVAKFIEYLTRRIGKKPYVEIETNGTIIPRRKLLMLTDLWNVSPKLRNSGMPIRSRLHPRVLQTFNAECNSTFKFVVTSYGDWAEILQDFIGQQFVDREKVILVPAGNSQGGLRRTRRIVADICKLHTLRMSDRLHVSVWNKKARV